MRRLRESPPRGHRLDQIRSGARSVVELGRLREGACGIAVARLGEQAVEGHANGSHIGARIHGDGQPGGHRAASDMELIPTRGEEQERNTSARGASRRAVPRVAGDDPDAREELRVRRECRQPHVVG